MHMKNCIIQASGEQQSPCWLNSAHARYHTIKHNATYKSSQKQHNNTKLYYAKYTIKFKNSKIKLCNQYNLLDMITNGQSGEHSRKSEIYKYLCNKIHKHTKNHEKGERRLSDPAGDMLQFQITEFPPVHFLHIYRLQNKTILLLHVRRDPVVIKKRPWR